jgi:RNA polymerase sigma-70 factor, ECF subfamily
MATMALTLGDRLRTGDESALADIVMEHVELVAAVVWRTWPSVDAAELEDITAEVVAECWRRRLEFAESRGSLAAWLGMLAKYRTLDHLRAHRRRALLVERLSMLHPRAPTVVPEYQSDLDAVLVALDPRQRAIVYLRYVADQSISQIARALNLTEKAVTRRLERARSQLRTALAEHSGGLSDE